RAGPARPPPRPPRPHLPPLDVRGGADPRPRDRRRDRGRRRDGPGAHLPPHHAGAGRRGRPAAPAPPPPPTPRAVAAPAARLAEGYLRARLAVRDERLLTRNLPHLVGLRDEPGALLSASGRGLGRQPAGGL